MEPVILALEKKYAGKVDFIIVDITDTNNDQLVSRFNIYYIPDYYFIGSKGTVIDRFTGEITQTDLEVKINNLLNKTEGK